MEIETKAYIYKKENLWLSGIPVTVVNYSFPMVTVVNNRPRIQEMIKSRN
jgi:hypothetical protein